VKNIKNESIKYRMSGSMLAPNGLGIGDGGAFEKHEPTFAQMSNSITTVALTTGCP
jgi:hypothetical protein